MSMFGQPFYRVAATGWGHGAARRIVRLARRCGVLRTFKAPLDCLELSHPAVAELMRLWRRMHWTSGDGMMTPDERLAIFALAYGCRADGDIVELGAWKGLTTCYLAAACRARGRGHVFAVDTFEGTREFNTRYVSIDRYAGSTLTAFKRSLARAGVTELVTPCVGFTTEMARQHRDQPVAFLLIDADHSYAGVKADFASWFPLVAAGGMIVFHDYAMPDAGVAKFVDGEVVARQDVAVWDAPLPPNVFAVVKTVERSMPVDADSACLVVAGAS